MVLRAQGHEVEVLGPGVNTAAQPDWVTLTGPARAIAYNGSVARVSLSFAARRAVDKFLRKGHFDVVHLHEPNAPSLSMLALGVSDGPFVATYHASSSQSWALKLARPFLSPRLDKIQAGIAVSEMARRWQVEQMGGDPLLIPNGVDTRTFSAARHDTNGPVRIAFLGRLDEPRKGLSVLLEALRLLDRRVNVSVMGAGKRRESIPGVDIEYLGKVTDAQKAHVLGASDIFVAPNLGGESFGIILVEAMAAGCAVLASDLEAFRAVCASESAQPAGHIFRNADSADLAQGLRMLIDDSAYRKRLIEAGQLRSQIYDWERVSQQILAVYETVAAGRGA
ncbi:glycosyltransferase family 4 protein [Corynebacterium tapiri]